MARADVHELAAPYALGALETHERDRFEEHLARCPRCLRELPELLETAAVLAVDAPPADPPPALRARILAGTRPAARAAALRRPRRRLPVAGLLAAAAVCAAVGLGIWALVVSHELRRQRAATRVDAQALAIVSDPAARRYPLDRASGQIFVTRARRAALAVAKLRAAPRGKTYELWVVVARHAQPAGVFRGGGQTLVVLERRVPAGAQVAVSLEPDPGTTRVTGPILFGAQAA